VRTRAIRIAAIAVVTTLTAFGAFRYVVANAPPSVGVGSPAPRFIAQTTDAVSESRSLDDYRGQPVLLNVWATWCDPCRDEMPSMQRLYEALKDRGLRVVAISVDDRGSDGLIREFAKEHQLTFDILHDNSLQIMKQYQMRGVPETFLISKEGAIVGTRFVADWATDENRTWVARTLLGAAAAK
jgi:peroxiredoxin